MFGAPFKVEVLRLDWSGSNVEVKGEETPVLVARGVYKKRTGDMKVTPPMFHTLVPSALTTTFQGILLGPFHRGENKGLIEIK